MDKKAKDILLKTYWSPSGWKKTCDTNPDDFKYAKSKGLMFDPVTISHDECVDKIIKMAEGISSEYAAKAFLSSLSTRRLDWRSGIASHHIAKRFQSHKYNPVESGYSYADGQWTCVSYTCKICRDLQYGIIGEEEYVDEDVNVLNFERIKWGGVRHGELLYILFDLEQFTRETIPEPTGQDIEIFKNILAAIDSCGQGNYPSALRDRLKDVPNLKSNKNERSIIIEILACIGILEPKSYDRAIAGKNDWTFVEYWRGEDGYNQDIVDRYFGKFIQHRDSTCQ